MIERDYLLKFRYHRDQVAVLNLLSEEWPAEIKKRQRGKWGGLRHTYKPQKKLPLPTVILAKARAVKNKVDELVALTQHEPSYKNASAIVVMESWLHPDISDSQLLVDGFSLYQADRDPNTSRKSTGGGCVYVVYKW